MYTWHLESKGDITSKEGFSVVAPMRVIIPCSTALSSESCCDLLNLCISSINKMGLGWLKNCCFLAFSMVSLTSLTPECTALNAKKGLFSVFAIIPARVVFPTPGGPHNMNEGIFPDSITFLSSALRPTRCSCPKNPSSVWFGSIVKSFA